MHMLPGVCMSQHRGTGSFTCSISRQVKNLSFQAVQTIIYVHFKALQQAPLITYNGVHH